MLPGEKAIFSNMVALVQPERLLPLTPERSTPIEITTLVTSTAL